MTGKTPSEETLTQMSISQQLVDRSGENNPIAGKVTASAFQSGANNPIFGKSGELSPVSIQVNVYSLDNVLVRSFSSQSICSKWLGVNQSTVSKYIKSGRAPSGAQPGPRRGAG